MPAAQWKLRSFCVIIPMYNEERGAESCVRRVSSVLAAIPIPSKLIAVNDGSGDRTGEILNRLAAELPNDSPSTKFRVRSGAPHRCLQGCRGKLRLRLVYGQRFD